MKRTGIYGHMESLRNSSREILKHSDRRWSARLLRQDLEELRREQLHLRSKLTERALTDWELGRVQEISQEIIKILGKISGIRIPV